jgi:hypothetical protein
MRRDDFSETVKKAVAARAGHLCSNRSCRAPTSGPQSDPTKSVNLGVAGHITAASPQGPRFDPALSSKERRHADNAIWLCQNCGKLVDNDESRFTVEELRRWKREAEAEAERRVGRAATAQEAGATTHKTEGGRQVQARREKYSQVLAYLPAEHRKILSGLVGGMSELVISSGPVRSLEEGGFLLRELKTDVHKGLYRLHPEVEDIVRDYFVRERQKALRAYLEGIGEDEVEFLRLFTSPPPEAGQPEHPFLEFSLYAAAQRLIRRGVLLDEADERHRSKREKVCLSPEAIGLVEECVLKEKISRDTLTLDLGHIAASGAGGGGAPPYSYAKPR